MVKHFHDEADCSARVVDWVDINKAAKKDMEPVVYLGNYLDDDNDGHVYALFGIHQYRFCVKIY